GWIDAVIMAVNNALLAFPGILLALGLLAVFGSNQYGIIFALAIAHHLGGLDEFQLAQRQDGTQDNAGHGGRIGNAQ
ncbi:hypothetical protein ACC709_37405, partial [Rhizobium ruizarguesonis]